MAAMKLAPSSNRFMQLLIADSFTDSLSWLNGDEQKVVKTAAFDLQIAPANPGMSFHRLDKAKDKSPWAARESSANKNR
jgi:hypothetical protein